MVSIVQSALFGALFLVLASSVLITSLFKIKALIPYLLSIYLLSFANILIAGEIAGLFQLLNNRFFFLFIHLVILAISFVLWIRKEKPDLFTPLTSLWKNHKSNNPWKVLKHHPLLVILGLGVAATYLLSAILVLKIPPNNYDSMTCHMVRVGFWLQNGSFLPWSTWFTQQVDYPINAQVPVLWSILFWRTDTFAGFTDWFAAIASILSVYGIARCLKLDRSKALFASLIFAFFPQILLQSSTTMPHLVGAALTACAFYFLFLGFTNRSGLLLGLSGLAIGMAAGVHILVIFTLPGYVCSALYLSLKNKKVFSKSFLAILISAALSFTLLSSYIYIQNLVINKSPFGASAGTNPWIPASGLQETKQESYWNPKNVTKYTFFNLNKYIFASFDLTGLPIFITEPLFKIRDAIFIPWFDKTHIPKQSGEFDINARMNFVSENSAWFGMVGFLLFYPLFVIGIISAIKKKESIRGILLFNIALYVLIWSALIARENNWSVFSGRYFIPAALFFAPLIGMVYKKGFWFKSLCTLMVIASLCIGYGTMLNNYAKPLISQGAIFKWTRLEKMYNVGWDQYPIIQAVDENVPPKETLGLALTKDFMEYPFFGEYFQHTIVHIYPYDKMNDVQWLKDSQVNWIVSCVDTEKPEGFAAVTNIVLNSPLGASSECLLFKRE